jgi:hypothetical protein
MKWFDPSSITNDEELDIRFHIEKGLVKKKSVIINIVALIAYYIQFVSPPIWYAKFSKKNKPVQSEWFPMWVTEGWLFFKFICIGVLILLIGQVPQTRTPNWFLLQIFPIWFLLDNLTAVARDLILAPNLHNNKMYVYDFQRWMILTLLGALEVVLCFSELIIYYSANFENLNHHVIINSIYLSSVTFCTLGYGDIHPNTKHYIGQLLITFELFYYFIFLAVKIPIAISMFSVRIIDRSNKNNQSIQ